MLEPGGTRKKGIRQRKLRRHVRENLHHKSINTFNSSLYFAFHKVKLRTTQKFPEQRLSAMLSKHIESLQFVWQKRNRHLTTVPEILLFWR